MTKCVEVVTFCYRYRLYEPLSELWNDYINDVISFDKLVLTGHVTFAFHYCYRLHLLTYNISTRH